MGVIVRVTVTKGESFRGHSGVIAWSAKFRGTNCPGGIL